MDIDSAIVDHLLADQELTALVRDRIFPLAIPQADSDLYPSGVIPAIVWQRVSTPRTLSLTGESGSNPRFQFSVYADDLIEAREIAQVLNKSLDFFIGTLGGKAKAQVLKADYRDSYEYETGLYRSDVDFFVFLNNKKG